MAKLLTVALLVISLTFCQESSPRVNSKKAHSTAVDNKDTTATECEPGDSIPKKLADSFDYPVGPPDGKGYYKAQEHGEKNTSFNGLHLGEDWNGVGGGNSDLGDTIYCIANGYVNYCEHAGPGWGNVIKITHYVQDKDSTPYAIESLYGHLDTMLVQKGQLITKGIPIGTIGNADGAYWAHLHLELRKGAVNPVGGGYENKLPENQLSPSQFINEH